MQASLKSIWTKIIMSQQVCSFAIFMKHYTRNINMNMQTVSQISMYFEYKIGKISKFYSNIHVLWRKKNHPSYHNNLRNYYFLSIKGCLALCFTFSELKSRGLDNLCIA